MKLVVCVLLIVVAVVLAHQEHEIQQRWNTVHHGCQQSQKTRVPDIIFEQLKRGEKPHLPPNFGLHANCMLVDLGYQDRNGHANADAIRHIVKKYHSNDRKVEEVVRECSHVNGDKEKVALDLFACFGKNRINIGQL